MTPELKELLLVNVSGGGGRVGGGGGGGCNARGVIDSAGDDGVLLLGS